MMVRSHRAERRRLQLRLMSAPGARRTARRLVGAFAVAPVVLVAAVLAGCTPTSGGTASVTSFNFVATLHFDAVSGRSNDITVSLDVQGPSGYPSSLLLTDSESPVTPGAGCTRVSDNTVRCSSGETLGFPNERIRLGDADDTFATSVAFKGQNLVDAGSGDDTLHGGPGDDTLVEGSDGFDRDSFSGGPGSDFLSYGNVQHAVSISLNDLADDGRAGEGDNVKSDIEQLLGTGAADTLTGSAHNNSLRGGGGNDVVSGGPGGDALYGDEGFDALDGGSDSDYCDVGPDGGRRTNCESGP